MFIQMFAENFPIFFGRIFAQFQTSFSKFICLFFREKIFDNSKSIHIKLNKMKWKEKKKQRQTQQRMSNTFNRKLSYLMWMKKQKK